MTTRQQQDALDYFRKHAGAWRAAAGMTDSTTVNVIQQRNDYVLHVANVRPATRSFLDVGCGSGELVCQMSERNVDSIGVDYAPEMIALASKKARDQKATRAKFVCESIFDFEMAPGSYDLVSANGFIEYISVRQMYSFFDLVREALAPGGSFVVGSRNRLFNLVSMNDFTLRELDAGDTELLMREAVTWATADEMPDVTAAQCASLQAADTEHVKTGVDVATRFQYTPFQLIASLRERGFQPVAVSPVHIHGVPSAFKDAHSEIHASIANMLQSSAPDETRLLPYASTFMLHVRKS